MLKSLKKTGRCHVFGDSIPLDEGVMAFSFAIGRITDPAVLIPHLFEGIDPSFVAVQGYMPSGLMTRSSRRRCSGKPLRPGWLGRSFLLVFS